MIDEDFVYLLDGGCDFDENVEDLCLSEFGAADLIKK